MVMIRVDAIGDACPIPVVKTKNAIRELHGAGTVETLVDNEIAVQNLSKMARQKGYGLKSEKLAPNRYKVTMEIGEPSAEPEEKPEDEVCPPTQTGGERKNTVVVIASSKMGEGSEELGAVLLKGFLYALSQQETLPKTILFYNGGAALTCAESPALEDLKSLASQGVEILTCGTCLNYYGLTEKLEVGEITNMYVIAEKMTRADLLVKP
jgi:selenium metabolism protein YedF